MIDLAEKNEADILRVLRRRYEQDGYTFVTHPTGTLVPSFLGNYRPDALAISDKGSIVIEIRSRAAGSSKRISDIAAVVERQPNWKFQVFYTPNFRTTTFEASSAIAIVEAVNEVFDLQKGGHDRAAFLMAWSTLEAIVRTLHANERDANKPMIPSEIVEWLAQSGNIDAGLAKKLRRLVKVRNGVVHGDLGMEIQPSDTATINEILFALLDQLDVEGGE